MCYILGFMQHFDTLQKKAVEKEMAPLKDLTMEPTAQTLQADLVSISKNAEVL